MHIHINIYDNTIICIDDDDLLYMCDTHLERSNTRNYVVFTHRMSVNVNAVSYILQLQKIYVIRAQYSYDDN